MIISILLSIMELNEEKWAKIAQIGAEVRPRRRIARRSGALRWAIPGMTNGTSSYAGHVIR